MNTAVMIFNTLRYSQEFGIHKDELNTHQLKFNVVHSKDTVAFCLQNKESQPKTYTQLKYFQVLLSRL